MIKTRQSGKEYKYEALTFSSKGNYGEIDLPIHELVSNKVLVSRIEKYLS